MHIMHYMPLYAFTFMHTKTNACFALLCAISMGKVNTNIDELLT